MLALLGLVIVAFATMLLILSGHADRIAEMPAGGIASSVVAALVGLYVVTGREGRTHGGRVVAALAIAAAGGAAAYISGMSLSISDAAADLTGPPEARPSYTGLASVRIRRGDDGRIVAKGRINAAATDLVVDFGSTAIVLKASDAERAGIDIANASFTTPLTTAAGETVVAPVRLADLEIGGIHFVDLEAFVAQPGTINENLLGMNFLRRLSSYEVKGQFATLRQ